jgi:hypothetical protein
MSVPDLLHVTSSQARKNLHPRATEKKVHRRGLEEHIDDEGDERADTHFSKKAPQARIFVRWREDAGKKIRSSHNCNRKGCQAQVRIASH